MFRVVSKWIALFAILFVAGLRSAAQDFKIQQFRTLPNDISAYIAPVYDLNHEACALLKVVCEERFAFSTPLGIIRRKNEVGEVWLYVPHGTRMITLKHPLWGVLRDYTLPVVLESRMTYELVVQPPLDVRMEQFLRIDKPMESFPGSDNPEKLCLRVLPVSGIKRIPMKSEYFVMATVMAGNDVLPGIRAGVMKRHGMYVSVHSDFGSWNRQETGVCNAGGYLNGEGYIPYYTGRAESGELLLGVGAIHRLRSSWYVYEGGGYGIRRIYWQLAEGGWIRNADYSAEGWTAEAGFVYRCHRYMFSGGVSTLCGSYWMGMAGFGYCF